MKKATKYQVVGQVADFHPGQRLALSKEQAAARLPHSVSFVKGNVYEVIRPTQFKNGEELGVIGEVNKNQLEALDAKSKKKAKKAEKDDAAASKAAAKAAEAEGDAEAAEAEGDAEAAEAEGDEIMTLEEAIDSLNPEDPTHWTKKDGLPDLTVLKELTGANVSRDAVNQVAPDYNREAAEE